MMKTNKFFLLFVLKKTIDTLPEKIRGNNIHNDHNFKYFIKKYFVLFLILLEILMMIIII
jgi:hypothetical protein